MYMQKVLHVYKLGCVLIDNEIAIQQIANTADISNFGIPSEIQQ